MTKEPIEHDLFETRITLRLPAPLRDRLSKAATETNRSMNGEIISRLEESFLETIRVPEDLRRRVQFHAISQGRSINDEVVGMLETLYPQIPDADELLQELDDMIARAEELERTNGYETKSDPLFIARISEHIGRLRERITTLLTVDKVDKK
jgi:predicted HicB family RNase H-like nuclease